MSTELATKESGAIAEQAKSALAALREKNKNVAKTIGPPKYIPRLQLCIDGSKPVKDGLVKANNYALFQGSEPTSILGETFVGLFVDIRAKASEEVRGELTIVYGEEKDNYQKIAAKPLDRYVKHGPEVLIWVPASQAFCTLHFGQNASLDQLKDQIAAFMGKAVDFLQKPAENKKTGDKWQAIRLVQSDKDFTLEDIPAPLLVHTLNQFNNPKDRYPEEEDEDR